MSDDVNNGSTDTDTDTDTGTGNARVSPGTFGDLGPLGWGAAKLGSRVTGTTDVHLFSTLGRAKRLFPAWLAYSGLMMPFGILSRKETELVILRVAHQRGSRYERRHHERIGSRVGLSRAEIERTTDDPSTAEWSPRTRAMLVAADQIVSDRDVDDAAWAELSRYLSECEQVAFVQLVNQYDGLATTLHTLRIQLDEPRD